MTQTKVRNSINRRDQPKKDSDRTAIHCSVDD